MLRAGDKTEYGYGLGGVEISDGAGNTTLTDGDGQYQLAPCRTARLRRRSTVTRSTRRRVKVTVAADAGQTLGALPPRQYGGLCLPGEVQR